MISVSVCLSVLGNITSLNLPKCLCTLSLAVYSSVKDGDSVVVGGGDKITSLQMSSSIYILLSITFAAQEVADATPGRSTAV